MKFPRPPRDDLNRVRLFYWLTKGALGIWYPFLNVYYEQQLHLTGREIGVLAAISPLMSLLIAPVWGNAADARGSRLALLRWALAGAAGAVVLMSLPHLFLPLLITVIIFYLFHVSIIPLSDGVVAGAAAEKGVPYGDLRLWGSLGFAFWGVLYGQLVGMLGPKAIFYFYAGLTLVALPVGWRMVAHEAPPKAKRGQVFELLRDKPLARFMVVVGLAALGMQVGYVFVYVHLAKLGASGALIGAISAVGGLAEVPSMWVAGRLMRKYKAPLVFAAGVLLFAMGWACYALIRVPWLGLPIQVLNGIGMGFIWPACVTYTARRSPAEQGAGAQSLLNAVMLGIAPLIASQVAGFAFDLSGSRTVLWLAAALMGAAVVLFAMLRRGETNVL